MNFQLSSSTADAQIGTVTVGEDWIASSPTARTSLGADGQAGTNDEAKLGGVGVDDVARIFSKVHGIAIGGQVLGTVGGAGHFGLVVGEGRPLQGRGTTLPLLSGKSNDVRLVGIAGHVLVRVA